MKTIHLALITFLLFPAAALLAQGSLTPPGAPAPTMKTLDQVEPRKEVNAANTPGDASNLFIISSPGSYYLSGNITGVAGRSGVLISADNVTLDLNGFQLIGVTGATTGIPVSSLRRNVAIRNGSVRDWPGGGIGSGAVFSLFEDLRLYRNGTVGNFQGNGLTAGGGSVIRRCIASFNLNSGFVTTLFSGGGESGSAVVVEDCVATGNTVAGFALNRAVASNCNARGNGGDGFTINSDSTLTNCMAGGNGGSGIGTSTTSPRAMTLTNCTASENTGAGIFAGGGSTLSNCTANLNSGGGILVEGAGTLNNCTVQDNTGTYGIRVFGPGTLKGCTAFSNDVNFGIYSEGRSTLTACTASENNSTASASYGIFANGESTISNCTAIGNTNSNTTSAAGVGIRAGAGSMVKDCTASSNNGDGILIVSDSRVVGNTCDSNGLGAGDGAGIHSTSTDNRIENNTVTDNSRGIDVDLSGSLIIKNSASGNSVHYDIVASNSFGPLVTVTAVGDITPTAGANHPWANFIY